MLTALYRSYIPSIYRTHTPEKTEMNDKTWPKLLVRMPPEMKVWLARAAERNDTSQTTEIKRAILEKMQRELENSKLEA